MGLLILDHARQEDTFDAPIDEVENLPCASLTGKQASKIIFSTPSLIVFLLVGSTEPVHSRSP